ncbi:MULTISPECIES: hypothetical protein [unclassified Burkholderia]|uniref:hypothetical protein n=1 Tax=unclassified Burkholderia TaxID=2613784 RepID=UPI000F55CE83|nr:MULTISPECIES: hypothetical protein [unclassified Burkholderia]RQR46318.1 hypothetical protein DIE20_02420 [Burkholderia sp. Bp9131]RQR78900.1 hypothetical protein DIE12_04125 [Burkholderia sp. Bp9015]RQS30129.1 hypothetical protein DIE05_11810 [Burkholderia sp. Bp8995]RQS48292.1 hypothetical protein DIE00_12390 [Burkholderia sp. Bp8989]RQZ51752.1 hypothetical protein DIE17_02585 [Burkholderia sp. Bp9099]
MFDLDGMLLLPDRRPISLPEVAGSRGLVVVGVGRGGERGFQMVHRFHDVGERLAAAGIHLAFVYPRESARHVMDPISVASARLRHHPRLLLDADGCCFAQGVPPRVLRVVYLSGAMQRLVGFEIDMRDAGWETEFQAFLMACRIGPSH